MSKSAEKPDPRDEEVAALKKQLADLEQRWNLLLQSVREQRDAALNSLAAMRVEFTLLEQSKKG